MNENRTGEGSAVALLHCDTAEEVYGTIRAIMSLLGRERIVDMFRSKRVLLKPNLCIDYPPQRGATTHPAVVEAMIRIVKDAGGTPVVGDGPIVGIRGNIFRATGMEEVCGRYGVMLVNFNQSEGRRVRLQGAAVYPEALITEHYFRCDTVVNLPIFKSNMAYWLSGALKNMKGLLVGREKHTPHRLGVPESVADLNRMVRQDLVIMDGLVGMMGDGPSAGEAAEAKLLIGGFDPVAVDSLAATIMGFDPRKIPMIAYAEAGGVGTSHITVRGDRPDSFHLNFRKPSIARHRLLVQILDRIGKTAFGWIQRRTRLLVDGERCTLCRRCLEACPFGAVSIDGRTVRIDMDLCDLCLCCTEACGQNAIILKGLLAKADAFMKH
ncbi:MAG: DUF362 domain-containing protein [Spirochaetes bacterium]|nr:DUF362 domain-containing protein [Spirochaetota bacterium]